MEAVKIKTEPYSSWRQSDAKIKISFRSRDIQGLNVTLKRIEALPTSLNYRKDLVDHNDAKF
jgi:hypothetical protein